MIYLIGGPSKCGKTTLAKRLAYKHRISWISADTLQNIVWAYTSKAKRPALFPHSRRRVSSNDKFYATYTSRQIVQGYIAQGKTSYDAIRMLTETYLKDEEDIIIEGYQVTPEIVHRIKKKFGRINIRAVFLVKHNERKIVRDIHRTGTSNDWILRRTKNTATYGRIAKMVVEYSHYFETQAKRHGYKVFNMSQDFTDQIQRIEKYLIPK